MYKRQGTPNITNNALSLENLKALAAVAGKTTTVNSKSVTVMTDDKMCIRDRYIKMLLNSIRIVKISYFRKAYWKEKQVCHFQIFHGNLKKYLPKKAVYMVSLSLIHI